MPPQVHEPIIGFSDFKIISYQGTKTVGGLRSHGIQSWQVFKLITGSIELPCSGDGFK